MPKSKKNGERERRITMEAVVDAYGPDERAMGWYYYLEDKLCIPFSATCIAERAISPLRKGDEVEVVAMGPEEECAREMFVAIRWEKRPLAVPLSQLKPIIHTDSETKEAVADWHYWVAQGYEF